MVSFLDASFLLVLPYSAASSLSFSSSHFPRLSVFPHHHPHSHNLTFHYLSISLFPHSFFPCPPLHSRTLQCSVFSPLLRLPSFNLLRSFPSFAPSASPSSPSLSSSLSLSYPSTSLSLSPSFFSLPLVLLSLHNHSLSRSSYPLFLNLISLPTPSPSSLFLTPLFLSPPLSLPHLGPEAKSSAKGFAHSISVFAGERAER